MLGFGSYAFLSSFFSFLHFARDKTLIAMEWEPWAVQHGQCPVQLLRWRSISSLFSSCMRRETLMHLLFTRNMKIARCYRYLSGLWHKRKKDCKEVVVCSIGMEVVMLEEKKRLKHIGSTPFWKLPPLIPTGWISWGSRPVASGLSSIRIEVPVCKFISGEPSWRLVTVPVHHPQPNSQREIKYLHRSTQIISHLLQG